MGFSSFRPLALLLASLTVLYLSLLVQAQPAEALRPVMQLTIPAIALDEPVYPVQIIDRGDHLIWPALDNSVAWHNTSASAGQMGNTVLNGHSTLKGQVFQNLYLLKEGAQIKLVVKDQVYTYFVRRRFLVQEEGVSVSQRRLNARWIEPTQDERVTLVTCADGTRYRLIVVAFP